MNAQLNLSKSNPAFSSFGYLDRGDSIEFVFGQQTKLKIGGVEVYLEKWLKEIRMVNLAADFNGWSPNAPNFQMKKVDSKLFTITLRRSAIGKKGELRQFKFVLNNKYWVEPPVEAQNKFTGKDGNTNLTLRL